MARSIWTGAIGFGLVNVPVKLYSATEDKNVRFHQLEEGTGKRVRNERVTDNGKEVPYEKIVRGYEVSKGKYVTLTDDDLVAAEPVRSRTIEIEDFVDLHEIDPIYYAKTYFLFPDQRANGGKPFVLLRRALEEAERIGIGRFVMREHEYLAAIRPYGAVLALETMYFPDEIRDPKKIAEPPKSVRVSERELEMATRLIDSLTTKWDPSRYRDTHRERVLDIIRRKAKGEEIVAEAPAPDDHKVVDLMEVLRASIENSGKRRSGAAARPRRSAKKTTKQAAKRSAPKGKPAKRRRAS
jgi:DNA end-binding protein Ku